MTGQAALSSPRDVVTPETPPPQLRTDITSRERRAIEAALGPIGDDELLRAVRDGRGREFQRLEFLGDSVLDLVLTAHRWVEPECPRCKRPGAVPEASDRHLAAAARQAGLGSWLEWAASDERIADLVETCVAATWLSGGWQQASAFISSVVHPIGPMTVPLLTRGVRGEPGRAARRVGSAVLELAAGRGVFEAMGDASEGALSTARAVLHRASAIAQRARQMREFEGTTFPSGDDDTVLSQVEDTLATVVARSGADAGLTAADPFVSAVSG